MKETIGRVIEVFIPDEFKNGTLLDVMDRTIIGFKVMTEDGLREIIEKQDEYNATIMKNDMVNIIEETINGKEDVHLEILEDEDYDR